jgi:hypothetical protein
MSTYQEQSTTKKPNTDGSGIICGMATLVFIVMIVAFGIASIPSFHSMEKQCYISNVTYPTEINSNSFSSNDPNFVQCDCGRRCMSDLGYCVRVFVSYENSTKMAFDTVAFTPSVECTIAETECQNGEALTSRTEALNEAAEQAEPYLNIMETNSTFPCYEFNGNIFVTNPKVNYITILSVLGGFVLLFSILTIYVIRN